MAISRLPHATAATPQPAPMSMKAIVQRGYGRPLRVLEVAQVARPRVGADDVLVQVRGTSVNPPDRIAVTGVPHILRLQTGLRRPGTPVRGSDVGGVVVAIGGHVTHVQRGDEVFGSVWDNRPLQPVGTFAELTAVPASQVIKKPSGIDFVEAGASVMSGLTALNAIRDVGGVGEGTRILINGASGGVGTTAVQIAKSLGAEVTGVTSTRNLELVRSLGADHAIDYTREDFTHGAKRYDVILDNVMNHAPPVMVRLLADDGVFIPNSAGTSGGLLGGMPRVIQAMVMSRRNPHRVRVATCAVTHENLTALSELLESGKIKVVIDHIYPLDQTAQAVEHMASHHARGKVAISVPS